MIGTDWLRRKAAAAVRIGDAPLGQPTHADVQRTAPPVQQAPEKQPTEAEPPTLAERVTRRMRELAAARAAEVLDCPCAVIYERCYYGH